MQTFYHKDLVISAVSEWAEKTEHRADMVRTISASAGVIKAALILGQAVSNTIGALRFGNQENSPVQSKPLTLGYLDRYFNKHSELTHTEEYCKTFEDALSVEPAWPGYAIDECFRIAHEGGDEFDYNNEFILARTGKNDKVVNADEVEIFSNRAELMDYLNQHLPDFV